ncbi:hypothetical protein [Methylobacter sp. S3L5C]|uniref:hypothetical protein n=1 Tax=Methylobacter sp. S3L5C TaxID=2839024 RepID=UPI001FAD5A35|nr:hypothetical protein [Methylobacter sp. S3L5C]
MTMTMTMIMDTIDIINTSLKKEDITKSVKIHALIKAWQVLSSVVLGCELGNGDPLASGLGAAADSFLGNGMSGGR